MTSEEQDRALAANEAVHREINDAIERGRWPGEDERTVYRCECAQRGCTAMLELTRAQYDQLRAHPRRFAVSPGHEDPAVEVVVARESSFVLVEKLGRRRRVSEASDPRG